jgi:hypothetical protein
MALQKMNFTKVWTNPADFPTYESQETKVRSDMQLLFDELRDAHNALIDALKASEIPFTETAAIAETNVQAAIENVQRQIAEAISGAIPDDSLTGDKMVEGAVDTRELADDAVTGDKIADDSVGHPQLKDDAVWGNNIKDGEITAAKFAPNILPNKADLDDGILRRTQRRLRLKNPAITNGYTIMLSDAETALYLTNATAGTITIPTNANAAISVGAMIPLICSDAQVTINPASGVSLFTIGADASGSIVIKKKNTVVLLFKIAENVWFALIPGVREGQVGETDLANNAVTRSKVKDGEIVYGKLGPAAVHTAELDDGAVTPVKTTGLQKIIHKATATLLGGASNWPMVGSYNTQKITVKDENNQDVSLPDNAEFVAAPNDPTGWEAAADCMLFPPTIENGVGKLIFTCGAVPEDNIPITVYFWEG